MSYNVPEDVFIFKDVPTDTKPAIARTAEARVRMTTKSAVQWYIAQYLDSTGIYRSSLQSTAPFAVSYVTDLSGNTNGDNSIYDVQLARIWKGLRTSLPAIIIADTGMDYINSGLGGMISGYQRDPYNNVLRAEMLAQVTLDIMIVAMDETTASDISDTLTYIFGPLTSANRSWLVSSQRPEDNWEVRLPQTGIKPGGLERRNITEDKVDSAWSTTSNLTVNFDGVVSFGLSNPLNPDQIFAASNARGYGTLPDSGYVNGRFIADSVVSVYAVPDLIRLNRPHKLDVKVVPFYGEFLSDNPNIAIVDENGVIHPKRLGEFNLVLVDRRTGISSNKGYTTLRSDKIKVVV